MVSVYLYFFSQTFLLGQEEALPKQEQTGVESEADAAEIPQEPVVDDQAVEKKIFIIKTINFDAKGGKLWRSRAFALIYHGKFQEGEILEGADALEQYIKDKTQLLLNQRVLESAEISYTVGQADGDGVTPVDLLVKTVDTWNIIALPKPSLDSNNGFAISINARDYNFLGTMSPLRLNIGYEHREAEEQVSPIKDVFNFELDSDTPFRLFGLNWNLDFDHLFAYALIGGDGTFSYKNITGLSAELPLRKTTITTGFEQKFILNEENPERYVAEYGNYADFYMANRVYASWEIPLGVSMYNFGELTYTPEVSMNVNYRPDGELEFWRKGPSITFSHRVGFGRINWLGNFRSGLEGSISNSNTYNFYSRGWSNNYGLSLKGHKLFTDWFGVSSFFQVRQWFFYDPASADEGYPPYTEVGDALRGVSNKSAKAFDKDYMISLNLDFTFRILRFIPSVWLHSRKLRFFDFDMHLVPFIDIALMQGHISERADAIPTPQGILASAGLELIVFPAFMRSFYLRASLGYNLTKFLETGDFPKPYGDEYFIGIGHHY
jgi:hypothetical protein